MAAASHDAGSCKLMPPSSLESCADDMRQTVCDVRWMQAPCMAADSTWTLLARALRTLRTAAARRCTALATTCPAALPPRNLYHQRAWRISPAAAHQQREQHALAANGQLWAILVSS